MSDHTKGERMSTSISRSEVDKGILYENEDKKKPLMAVMQKQDYRYSFSKEENEQRPSVIAAATATAGETTEGKEEEKKCEQKSDTLSDFKASEVTTVTTAVDTNESDTLSMKLMVEELTLERNTYKEQIDVLLKNIKLASSLASMDSGTYQNSFSRSSANNSETNAHHSQVINVDISTNPIPYGEEKDDDFDDNNEENLQTHYFFLEEQTALPKLISSIHRLQSNILHLSSESNLDITQVSTLHSQVQQYKSQNHKHKKVTKKLWKENQKLKLDLNTQHEEYKVLIKSMKKYYKQKRKEDIVKEERIVAAQSLMHENVLKWKQQQQQKQQLIAQQQQMQQQKQPQCTAPSGIEDQHQSTFVGNRGRTSTVESTYSEFEDFDYDCFYFGNKTGNGSGNSISTDTGNSIAYDDEGPCMTNSKEGDFNYNCNNNKNSDPRVRVNSTTTAISADDCQSSSYDNLSILSTNSCSSRSYVTDDNLPTLRLDINSSSSSFPSVHYDEARSINKNNEDSNLNDSGMGDGKRNVGSHVTIQQPKSLGFKRTPLTYTLTFPIGTDIGLQFQEMIIDMNYHHNQDIFGRDVKDQSSQELKGSKNFNRSRSFSDSSAIIKNQIPRVNENTICETTQRLYHNTSRQNNESSKPSNNIFENILSHFEYPMTPQRKKRSANVATKNMPSPTPTTPKMMKEKRIIKTPLSNKKKPQTQVKEYQNAILVCDFEGFDSSLNVRPTLGARLIAINDQPILHSSRKWTLDDVKEKIMELNSSSQLKEETSDSDEHNQDTNMKKTFKLTFRNDTLTKDQKDALCRQAGNPTLTNKDGECTMQKEVVVTANAVVDAVPSAENSIDAKYSATIVDLPSNPLKCVEKGTNDFKAEDGAKQSGEEKKTMNSKNNSKLPTKATTNGIDKFFGIFALGNPSTVQKNKDKNIFNLGFIDNNVSSKSTKTYPFYNPTGLSKAEKEAKNKLMRQKKLQENNLHKKMDKVTKNDEESQVKNDDIQREKTESGDISTRDSLSMDLKKISFI